MSRGRRRTQHGGAAQPTERGFPVPQGRDSHAAEPPLAGVATSEGMPQFDATNTFWECDHAGSPPSPRAFEEAVVKAITEGCHCERPLRVQCAGDHSHAAHWRYVPCGTRFANRCEACAKRYGAQARVVIQAGLAKNAHRPALAFTLTAPGKDEFGKPDKDFDHLAAVMWNRGLTKALHNFTGRLARFVAADDPDADPPGYLIVIEWQARGLAHVHGVVFGARPRHILEAAHGKRDPTGKRQVVVTGKVARGGRLVTTTQKRLHQGWSVTRTFEHLAPEYRDLLRQRYHELCFSSGSIASDDFDQAAFDQAHAALATGLTDDMTSQWRWGEQVHIEPFHGAESKRGQHKWARYLAKYLSKAVGVGPTATAAAQAHHDALRAAAWLLPCHVHDRYMCDCAKARAMVEQYGVNGNVMSKARKWGMTLSQVRKARSRKQAKACVWRVSGAGYSDTIVAEVRCRIARAERARDDRRAHRKAVPATVGPAAP